MKVRYDTAIPLSANWEQSYQALSHPAALGLDDENNSFGFQRGSSISLGWSARPVVVGRWGWSTPGSDAVKQKSPEYQEGQPLGDIVLAAEEPLGQGRIVVLGDMSCLNNEPCPAPANLPADCWDIWPIAPPIPRTYGGRFCLLRQWYRWFGY